MGDEFLVQRNPLGESLARLWRGVTHNPSLAALGLPGRPRSLRDTKKILPRSEREGHLIYLKNTFFRGRRFLMVAKYDIFKKINESIVWVEAVEDIVAVKKRLMSFASTGTDDYRVWDSTRQKLIDPLNDYA
jgi:hypothetical protein